MLFTLAMAFSDMTVRLWSVIQHYNNSEFLFYPLDPEKA